MPRYGDSRDLDCKVYVGELPRDVTEKELERPFSYYGPLKSVWVARNPPGFAFVEYEDPRDAEDAVRSLDGTTICGARARVELSTGKIRPKPWLRGGRDDRRDDRGGGRDMGGRDSSRGRRFDPSDRCYQCGERGHYAYDCKNNRSGGRSSRRRSRSRSRSNDRRSRSRTRSRSRRSRTRSYSRSRSRSPARN